MRWTTTKFTIHRHGLRKKIAGNETYKRSIPESFPVQFFFFFFPKGPQKRKKENWVWVEKSFHSCDFFFFFFFLYFLQAAHGFWGQARQKVITPGGHTPPTVSQDSEEEFIHLRLAAAPREQRRFQKQGEILTDNTKADQLPWTFGRQRPLEKHFPVSVYATLWLLNPR